MSSSSEFVILPLLQLDDDDMIDVDKIREITAKGLDRAPPEDRCMAWMVLLGVFPKNTLKWRVNQQNLISTYREYIKVVGMEEWHTKWLPVQVLGVEFGVEDELLMGLIHRDIVRTGRHIFLLPADEIAGPEDGSINIYAGHLRRLERILYILSKINLTLSYMQGFNEIVVPLYYTLYQAKDLFVEEDAVEALAFHALHNVIVGTKMFELFLVDGMPSAVRSRLRQFEEILQKHVPDVHDNLKKMEIEPSMYCYRWFTVMFSQEYEMPQLQQLWDTLFAHSEDLLEFMLYVGAAHLEMMKEVLTFEGFAETLQTIQGSCVRNVYQLLSVANTWWDNAHTSGSGTILHTAVTSILQVIKRLRQ